MGGRYTCGIRSGMLMATPALPFTITMPATFAAFTIALTVSRRGIVSRHSLGVVVGPLVVPMIRFGNERLNGLRSRSVHLGLLIGI